MKLGLILGTGFTFDADSSSVQGVEVECFSRQHRDTPEPVPPHVVDYVGNMEVLKHVDAIVATTACGSLSSRIGPGAFVCPDDMVDFTGYGGSFLNRVVEHPSANPAYDAGLRELIRSGFGIAPEGDGGTVVSIRGPRFATSAESRFYQAQGWDFINMTTGPETSLALELGIPMAVLGHVTDYDSGVPEVGDPSSLDTIRSRMKQGNARFGKQLPGFLSLLSKWPGPGPG